MGYETQLFLVKEYGTYDYAGSLERSGQVIGSINLSKAGYDSHTYAVLANAREAYSALRESGDEQANAKHAFFLTGADLLCLEGENRPEDSSGIIAPVDPYGEHISPVNVADLIEAMELDQVEDYEYRRFTLALGLLKAVKEEQWVPDGLSLWQYGH